jgi:hypothetical protein
MISAESLAYSRWGKLAMDRDTITMNSTKTAAILLISFASGAVNAADTVDLEERILPLFYQRCFSCHSENMEEPQGGLKLVSVKAIRESGAIVPRKPDESELLIRISLPHEDDSFMPPPEGGAQPFDEGELAMMKAWIRNGATFGDWVRFEHRQALLPHCGVAEERVLAAPLVSG